MRFERHVRTAGEARQCNSRHTPCNLRNTGVGWRGYRVRALVDYSTCRGVRARPWTLAGEFGKDATETPNTNGVVFPECKKCGPPAVSHLRANVVWPEYPLSWDIDLNSFPEADRQEWEQAAIDATEVWNSQLPVQVFERHISSIITVKIVGLTEHENILSDIIYGNDPRFLAKTLLNPMYRYITWPNPSCAGRAHFSQLWIRVLLDRATWTTDSWSPYNMDVRDMTSMVAPRRYTLVHELGHILGLDHTNGMPMWDGLDGADDDGVPDKRGCLTAADAANFAPNVRRAMECLLQRSSE